MAWFQIHPKNKVSPLTPLKLVHTSILVSETSKTIAENNYSTGSYGHSPSGVVHTQFVCLNERTEIMFALLNEMDRRLSAMDGTVTCTNKQTLPRLTYGVNVDISEDEEAYFVVADVPGLTREDVKLSVKENRLTLFGERRQESENRIRRRERRHWKLRRSLELPTDALVDSVEATLENGVLEIVIPKAPEAKSREIAIN